MHNWAGNLGYRARAVHRPTTLEALQEIVHTTPRLRPLGTRHAFSDIADTTGDLVSLEAMPRIFELDVASRTLTIDGAVRYGELCGPLHAAGFGLPNLASLPHISVAGAVATGTHGSGDRLGNLATPIRDVELVRADGELVRVRRGDADPPLEAVVVGLGALGVVTRLVLDVEPTYDMRQDVIDDLPLDAWREAYDEITALGDSVSGFTSWAGDRIDQVWVKRRVRPDDPSRDCDGDGDADGDPAIDRLRALGGTPADAPRHPIRGIAADACTAQLGVPGPWHDRLPHFRMDHTPSAGDELQSEYLVDRRHGPAAIAALATIRDRLAPLVQVSEFRTVAADDVWLSPAFERPSTAIHFTWVADWPAVRDMLPTVEAILRPFEPRPHWGKLSRIPGDEVAARYPRLPAFAALAARWDPTGRFRNDYLDRYLAAPAGTA
jgi:xylitol oxidase